MYEPDEKLVLVKPYGKEDSEKYLPVGTKVEFVKVDNERIVVMKEVNVKPVDDSKVKKEFKEFQKAMMIRNPRLRRYHPNFFVRTYFKIYYFFKDRFGNE
jgi:hypothetical protein